MRRRGTDDTEKRRRAAEPASLSFRPATPSRWKDVERLFGERGACGGCWCMVWRLPRKDYVSGKGAGNRRRLRLLVEGNRQPGVIAYDRGEPVGWCALAPRDDYPALARSRVLKPFDDQPVWSVSCLFVLPPWRRRGLSSALLSAAAGFAASRGARILEGYPVIPYVSNAPGAFLWTGTPGAFAKAGFREAHRWSKARPIMRLELTGTGGKRSRKAGGPPARRVGRRR